MRRVLKVLKVLKGRKSFAASKFREVVNLAISRIANLKKERSNKCSENLEAIQVFIPYASPFLKPALRRCGDLIKNQNRLDAYIIIEGYLNLLIERIYLFGNGRDCPAELKEAASGVVFATTRCKEIPELEQIKSILTSRFGREFISRAAELRNNNAPHKLLEEKLSEIRPSPESKMNLLKAIASQKSQQPPLHSQEQMIGEKISKSGSKRGSSEMIENSSRVFGSEDSSNSSGSRKKKNKGVALNTSSDEFTIELPSTSMQTRQKNKGLMGLNPSSIETSLDSFASTRSSVKPSSPNPTTQKNKGVGFKKTSPKPTGIKIPLSSKKTIQKNKVVPLNINPTPTNFDPQKRRYPTRSSSDKS